jgi:poly-gamma-glutamate capsule biosynthesis protein CapA/YwtB (metallophosphatase superfamily)
VTRVLLGVALAAATARAQTVERAPLAGRVVDEEGFGIRATVELGGAATECGRTGLFRFESSPPGPALLVVRADRFYPEYRVVSGEGGLVRMRRRSPTRLRLVFGGDAMMGRRFLKPDNREAPDRPLLRPDSLSKDAQALLSELAPALTAADHAIVNLESVLTRGEGTPVSKKKYSFRSPPETAEALAAAGVDLVTLGNNHTWDYGEAGLVATMKALKAAKLAYCGAGRSEKEALASAWIGAGARRVVVLSFSGIAGSDVPLQARGDRGGAAPMTVEAIRKEVSAALVAGAPVVVALHAGAEYQDAPTDRVREAALAAARAGAAIVVCHHPHVVSGFSTEGEALIAWGLGNLVFDQSRWEALAGMLLTVDLEDGRVKGASFLPLVHDGYVPRVAAGEFARHVARRVGALSPDLPVFWSDGRAVVGIDEAHRKPLERIAQLAPQAPLKLDLPGPAVFLRSALAPAGRIDAGRDLLRIGGFEDSDMDAIAGEWGPWTLSPSAIVSGDSRRSGFAGLKFSGKVGDPRASATTVHRVPTPDTITIAGWTRANNGGRFGIALEWCAEGEMASGPTQHVLSVPGGTRGWTPFHVGVDRLKENFSVRISLMSDAPDKGEGTLEVDDVAIIEWRRSALDLPVPNDLDWIRIVGTKEAQAVDLDLEALEDR